MGSINLARLFLCPRNVFVKTTKTQITIFFSDIASFTTIVESLPPKSSLLLLSRYFQEPSKTQGRNEAKRSSEVGQPTLPFGVSPFVWFPLFFSTLQPTNQLRLVSGPSLPQSRGPLAARSFQHGPTTDATKGVETTYPCCVLQPFSHRLNENV